MGATGRLGATGDMGAMAPMRGMGVTWTGGLLSRGEGPFGCCVVVEGSSLTFFSGNGDVVGTLAVVGVPDVGAGRLGSDAMAGGFT